jgi:hypothetical protein
MTFQPGDIVVCVSNGFPNGWLVCGTVYTVERVDFWVYLKDVAGGWDFDRFRLATDEEQTNFLKGEKMSETKIEGIPDGWEPVRFGNAVDGESYINGCGEVISHTGLLPTQAKRLIIRKIEKPKPGYQPFANAAEYLPHFGKPIKNRKTPEGFDSVVSVGEDAVYIAIADEIIELSYVDALAEYEFADGTPFGVEVVE